MTLTSFYHLFRAEWRKITGNRPVIWFLVWIFPLGAVLISFISLLVTASAPPSYRAYLDVRWDEQMLAAWVVPGSELGRLLMIGFASVTFAGEYQWGTWKNVLPRTSRTGVVLIKFLTVLAAATLGFTLMAIVLLIGGGLVSLVIGAPYEPALTGASLNNFLRLYLIQMAFGIVTMTIGVGYAALASLFSRSITGGIIVGIAFVVLEPLSLVAMATLGTWLRLPDLIQLYALTPLYNINNASRWILNGEPSPMGGTLSVIGPHSLEFSLLVLAVWVFGLIGLSLYLFRQQDITT